MTKDKLKQLEDKNQALEAELKGIKTNNSQFSSQQFFTDSDIDLQRLWNAIWGGRLIIISITLVFSIASVIYALSVPNEYKATALLAPASSSSSLSLSNLAGQIGGLASLAGINIGGAASEDKSVVAIEVMRTWDFQEKFIKENNIEVEVFAAEGWERTRDQLIIDSELYDVVNKKWVRTDFDVSKGQTEIPSSWELYEEFRDRLSISQDKASGIVKVSIEYYSPNLAKEWTEKIITSINSHVQKKDREEALKSIAYLNKKIDETNIADMQAVFYQLIEEQTKTLMLAEISKEYVFTTVSPAMIAEEESKPNRALISIIGALIGGILSLIVVFIRNYSSSTIRQEYS